MLHHLPHQLDKDIRVSKKHVKLNWYPTPGPKHSLFAWHFTGRGMHFMYEIAKCHLLFLSSLQP